MGTWPVVVSAPPSRSLDVLELAPLLAVNLARHVSKQTLQDVGPLKVVEQPRILSLAFLQQLVLVEYGFQRDVILVQQRVYARCCVESKSAARRLAGRWATTAGAPPEHARRRRRVSP